MTLPVLFQRVHRAMHFLAAVALALLLSFASSRARAADGSGGTIEGRVFNPATGEYLERARVTLEPAGTETFTNALGQYWFNNVPAGEVKVRVFYTGLAVQAMPVRVSAGQTAQQDFNLEPFEKTAPGTDVVKLSKYVVEGSKEMDAAAIAINEKRFASDIRNVIAADEFGPTADGNVGEILKQLPGVSIDYVGGAAMGISLNGVPAGYVPVTMNGFALASTTATAPMARDTELFNVATNNLSRIEVLHSPTPEQPGNALGGSVNMVPRGAFERSKPVLNTNLYVLMRDDTRTLHKTPGPGPGKSHKVHPGFDFSYVAPVNKKFGFTISGSTSQQYQPSYFVQTTWRAVTAGTAAPNLPLTTPDKPYLTDYLIRDLPRQSRRTSAGLTLDYKFTPADRVSVSLQGTKFDATYNERNLTFSITRVLPTDFTLDYTHGAPGGGTLTLGNGTGNQDRDRRNQNFSPSILYRHDGPIWKSEAGAGWSFSKSELRNMGKGFFASVTATRPNVTISFDDIFYLRPGRITVRDGTTNALVDPFNINTYSIVSASGNIYGADTPLGTGPGAGVANLTFDTQRSAYANLRRDFQWGIPFTLKSGIDMRQATRDYRGGTTALTFLGADGRASSPDDNAAQIYDPLFSQREGVFGFPRTDRMSGYALMDLYRTNPSWFTKNDATIYRSATTLSKHAQELVTAAYIRGDAAFMQHRLKITTGVRAEQTNVRGEGPLNDPTLNYRRDARGVVIDSNPNLAGLQPSLILPATDALGIAKLTSIDRGEHAKKEYFNLFPSINASYALRENLVARAAYYYSIGRPEYGQYANGLTLPDEAAPPPNNTRISVNNVGIKPWTAKSVKVSLEYYFQRVGIFSVGAFRRDFTNFFGTTIVPVTPSFLALYSLDANQYAGFDVSTQYNVPGVVRMDGYDFQYKQALTFLPQWARGVQVFANAAATRATGPGDENFANFTPRTYAWGISLTRPSYTFRANWNYKSRHRRALQSGQSIGPSTYAWHSKRLFVDLIGEYKLTNHLAIFGNIRNLNDVPEDFPRAGPETPPVAQFRQRDRYGALWIFGVKGTF
ncbi:MAG TPA: TonB-dependent receptor [Opitutaceae bacterium]|nr:TonB-dependent receptor [Opitutaceae bacterium]